MTDLHTDYLGLRLRSPIVASSSPYTGDLDRIVELADAGAGAIVLPSLFEEQIEHETGTVEQLFGSADADGTPSFPGLDQYNSGVEAYLGLVRAAKQRVDIPIIASLNGTEVGTWLRYTRLLEEAGADAVELNLYSVAADPTVSSAALEHDQLELVSLLADDVAIPLSVKVSPYYSSLSAFAVSLEQTGARGITMFNRFYLPDLDVDTLGVQARISLSTSEELRLPLRWIAILREHLKMSIAGSTGVHTGIDAAKLLLAGADVAMVASAVLQHGPAHIANIEAELREHLERNDIESVDALRGRAHRGVIDDPDAYERANYIGTLAAISGWFRSRG